MVKPLCRQKFTAVKGDFRAGPAPRASRRDSWISWLLARRAAFYGMVRARPYSAATEGDGAGMGEAASYPNESPLRARRPRCLEYRGWLPKGSLVSRAIC